MLRDHNSASHSAASVRRNDQESIPPTDSLRYIRSSSSPRYSGHLKQQHPLNQQEHRNLQASPKPTTPHPHNNAIHTLHLRPRGNCPRPTRNRRRNRRKPRTSTRHSRRCHQWSYWFRSRMYWWQRWPRCCEHRMFPCCYCAGEYCCKLNKAQCGEIEGLDVDC